ncbi:MAG: hypothetical protein CMC88_02635 [Flavobacteriaceae bacterium]|nr:hypothetical protein [Flavobacteriaceae bacterium]
MLNFFEILFEKVFSDKNRKKAEKFTLWSSIIGFITHLFLIYLNTSQIITLKNDVLLNNPISAIYTPFSIILIYEIYLLIFFLPRSFTTSVSKQFEIISLILIRRIFGDIPEINTKSNWFKTQENIDLIYSLLGVLILYYLIYQFNKLSKRRKPQKISLDVSNFIKSKKGVSLILLPVLILVSIFSLSDWIFNNIYLFNENISYSVDDINAVFYNKFFEILILADVFILLLSFQYTEKYSQLIRNTGFIISTILIRLSFSASGLTNVLLIISSVLFGLIILKVYENYQKL